MPHSGGIDDDSTLESISQMSAVVSSVTKKVGRIRFRWSSNIEYILTVIMYSFTVENYNHFTQINEIMSGNIIQWYVCILIIGMPIQYMQVALGQYTQLSSMYMKYLSPIGHGLSYAFIISTVLRLVPNAVIAGDNLLYLLNSLQSNLPWLQCKEAYASICWPGPICKTAEPCIREGIFPSATLYWNYIFMEIIPTTSQITIPDVRRCVTVIIMWLIVYCILIYTPTAMIKKTMRYLFVAALFMMVLMLIMLLVICDGAIYGFRLFFSMNLYEFLDISLWMKSVIKVIDVMSITKGGHILLGSYLQPKTSSGILTVLSVILNICVMTLVSFFLNVAAAIVMVSAKAPTNTTGLLYYKYEAISLTLFPNGIGFASVPQLWNVIYFSCSIIFSLTYIILNVRVTELGFEDSQPTFYRYRKYVLFTCLLVSMLWSVIYVDKGLYIYTMVYLNVAEKIFDTMTICIFTIIVSWIYGVQRLCDDIHFLIGVQPTKFWKICWYIVPLILCGTVLKLSHDTLNNTEMDKLFITLVVAILQMPIVLMAIIETFRFIRRRNLIGLIQPEERWGPPDDTERHLRNVFNPRKEIRSRRRNDTCQHKCLLNSKILKRIIAEEAKFHNLDDTQPSD